MTQVRFMTLAVLRGLLLFSALAAGSRVVAQTPNNPPARGASKNHNPAEGADKSKTITPADVQRFRLILTYHGASDKPYYYLVLAVQPGAQQHSPHTHAHRISEEQAVKLIEYLSASGFFTHAQMHGRKVPYVGGTAQIREREATIKPSASQIIESFDLASFWYLRRPGRYSVVYRREGMSASNSLSLTAGDAGGGDGDPIGKLLPLVHAKWLLVGNPNATGKVHPGGNREEAAGSQIIFQDNPTGYKRDMELVWLWLTEERAAERVAAGEWPPVSEYLGKISPWHLYVHATPRALERWPTVKEDIKKALAKKEPMGARTSATKPSEPMRARTSAPKPGQPSGAGTPATKANADDYRLLHDRYQARIFAAAKAGKEEDLLKVTDDFNDSIGRKLILVTVELHGDPRDEPRILLRKYYEPAMFAPGMNRHAIGEKALVIENAHTVVVATTPREADKWPDDLEITLLMHHVAKEDIKKAPAAPKWGEASDGLHTRVSAAKQIFRVGESIPVKLEIENVGGLVQQYSFPLIADDGTLHVVDEGGREVRYLGKSAMIPAPLHKLGAGELRQLRSCDLTKWHDLRQPGRYTARYTVRPASAAFEFEVIAPATEPKPKE